MERRSSKRTTPRKRYTVDPFEGVAELQDAATEGDDRDVVDNDDDSANEFQAGGNESPDEAEDEMSGVEGGLDDVGSDGAMSDVGEELLDDDISIASDPDAAGDNLPNLAPYHSNLSNGRSAKGKTALESEQLYTRGLQDPILNHASKSARRMYFFGPAQEDYEPFYKAKAKWADAPTLPTRAESVKGLGGFQSRLPSDAETVRNECQWYREGGGRDAFKRRQAVRALTAEEAAEYMVTREGKRSLLMGPHTKPKLHKLAVSQPFRLRDAWEREPMANGSRSHKTPTNYKNGFVLNLGARVHCVDWLASQLSGHQFLAVSVLPDKSTEEQPSEANSAPAFTAQTPQASSIQVWRFEADEGNSIDIDKPPLLSHVLCTRWGDVKALKWCPRPTPGDGPNLLATIAADGAIRLIDAALLSDNGDTDYSFVERVAFESCPPDTVCTCLAWLSSSRIAAGCANGCIAVWDIGESLCVSRPGVNHRPQTYSSVSTSYILSITSCYPSHPDMVLTTSMTGYVLLTDLTRPHTLSPSATAASQRTRVAQSLIHWSDWAQLAVSVDDSLLVKGYPMRRLFSTVGLGRVRSLATTIAGSLCHPYLLIGMANGEVLGLNPLRRVMDSKAEVYQQTWFAHEWRRPTTEEKALPTSGESSYSSLSPENRPSRAEEVGHDGLSRITEGFKVERIFLGYDDKAVPNIKDSVMFHTIHEKQSAITALAWNPNVHVGGWAAAGMADGLLRVEDIAV